MILFVCFALLSLDCFKILLTAWVAEKPLLGTCQICFSAVYFILIFFYNLCLAWAWCIFLPHFFLIYQITNFTLHPCPLFPWVKAASDVNGLQAKWASSQQPGAELEVLDTFDFFSLLRLDLSVRYNKGHGRGVNAYRNSWACAQQVRLSNGKTGLSWHSAVLGLLTQTAPICSI